MVAGLAAGFTQCCVCKLIPGPPGAGFAAHDVAHPNAYLCETCREFILKGGGDRKCPLCRRDMHRSTYTRVDGKWEQQVRLSLPVYPEVHRHFDSEIAGGRERLGLEDLEASEPLPLPVMSEAANAFGKIKMIRLTDHEPEDLEAFEPLPLPVMSEAANAFGKIKMIRLTDHEDHEPGEKLDEEELALKSESGEITRNLRFSSELRLRAQQIDAGAVKGQLEFHQEVRAAQQALTRDRDALARIEGVDRAGVVGNHGGALMHLNR